MSPRSRPIVRGAAALALALACFAPARAAAPATPAATPAAAATPLPRPPLTRMQVVRDTLFGTVIADPYRWLEDGKAPETRAWLASEEQYWKDVMKDVPGRDRLRARLDSLLRVDDADVPIERAGRTFFLRRAANQDLKVLVTVDAKGREQVLLDPNKMTPDRSLSVRLLDVSGDGSLAAVGLQKGGEDEIEVAFLDVASHSRRSESLPRTRYGSMRFTPDAKQLYYSRFTPEGPRVYRHRLGTDPKQDALLFGEGYGRDKIAGVSLSEDGAWLLISVSYGSAGDRVDLFAQNLKSDGPIVPILGDVVARFEPRFGPGDTLFVRTNWKAPNGRILAIDLAHPKNEWREVLAEGPYVIDSWTPAGGRLLVNYLANVVAQLYLIATDGHVVGAVPVGDLGSVRGLSGRWSQPNAYLSFESFTVPRRVLKVDATTNAVSTWWASRTPFRSADYVTKQLWCVSKDGTRVPIFVSYRRDIAQDGRAPAYLTGYGGFSVNETPAFSGRAAVWMENGGVWAVANLRGGSEFGESWHQAGMLDRKQNVFDDFAAAAGALVRYRLTSPERLAIAGGSNGGLLVGATLTQHPELCRVVVCSFPLLDMLRYHRFLVARFWVPEYGSSENEAQFRTLRAYSPYQNVKIGADYPAVLFLSGDSDTRVDPLHARKMTALVQSATGSDKPVLLHYDTGAGHSTGRAVSQVADDEADVLQFVFWQLGVRARAGSPPPLPPERDTGDKQP